MSVISSSTAGSPPVVAVAGVVVGAAPPQAANRTASTTADHRGKWVTLQSWRIPTQGLRLPLRRNVAHPRQVGAFAFDASRCRGGRGRRQRETVNWGGSGQVGVWRPQDWLTAMYYKMDSVAILRVGNGITTLSEAGGHARHEQGGRPGADRSPLRNRTNHMSNTHEAGTRR